jgi:ABC-type Na+ efflux pump permease subunit
VATLAILVVICVFMLFVLLANVGEQALRLAALLAVFVVSPLFFLGTALLYFDQVARLESPRRKRKES